MPSFAGDKIGPLQMWDYRQAFSRLINVSGAETSRNARLGHSGVWCEPNTCWPVGLHHISVLTGTCRLPTVHLFSNWSFKFNIVFTYSISIYIAPTYITNTFNISPYQPGRVLYVVWLASKARRRGTKIYGLNSRGLGLWLYLSSAKAKRNASEFRVTPGFTSEPLFIKGKKKHSTHVHIRRRHMMSHP